MSSSGPPSYPPSGGAPMDPNLAAYWSSAYYPQQLQQQQAAWYAAAAAAAAATSYPAPPPPPPAAPAAAASMALPPPNLKAHSYGTGNYRPTPPLPPGAPPPPPFNRSHHPGYSSSSTSSKSSPSSTWTCNYCKNTAGNHPSRSNCNRCTAPKTEEQQLSSSSLSQPPPPPPPPPQPPPPPVEKKKTEPSLSQVVEKQQPSATAPYTQPPSYKQPPHPHQEGPYKQPPHPHQEGPYNQPPHPHQEEPYNQPPHPHQEEPYNQPPHPHQEEPYNQPPHPHQEGPYNQRFPNGRGYDRGGHRGFHAGRSRGGFEGGGYAPHGRFPPPSGGRGGWPNRGRGRGGGFNPSLPPPSLGMQQQQQEEQQQEGGGPPSSNPNFEKLGTPSRGRGFFRGRGQRIPQHAAPDASTTSGGPPPNYMGKGRPPPFGAAAATTTSQQHSEPSASTTPTVVVAPKENVPQKLSEAAEMSNKEDDLLRQEEKFDKVFTTWEQNFEKWKADNLNNPDREYVKQQRTKMEEMRNQMLQRRNNIRSQRSRLIEMKRKWSEESNPPPGSRPEKQQEPEAKKPVPVMKDDENDDMDIENESDSGGVSNVAATPEGPPPKTAIEATKGGMPWDTSRSVLSQSDPDVGGCCIPGLGDGKDSVKEKTSDLMDLSSKDLENISKAVQTLTSSAAAANPTSEKPTSVDVNPTSSHPEVFPKPDLSTKDAPQLDAWGIKNKPPPSNIWNTESAPGEMNPASSNSPSSMFSRRPQDQQSGHKINPWGNFNAQNPVIQPWQSGAGPGGGNFNRRRFDDGYYGGSSQNFEPPNNRGGNSNNLRRDFRRDGGSPGSYRTSDPPIPPLGFHSGSSNVKVIDYGHKQKSTVPPVTTPFKSFPKASLFNAQPPSGRSQDKPLDFKSNSGPTFFMSKTSFVESSKPKEVSIDIDELIQPPGRYTRPPKIMIIFRGLPGSGKTHTVKAIKNLEAELGSETPRILSLDDYFEVDGKYEYERSLEETYRQSLLKSLKKQIDDGYFNFIMVESINNKTKHYKPMADYGLENGFEVYIAELEAGLSVCAERNVHGRSLKDMESLIKDWEDTPIEYKRIDLKSLDESKSDIDDDEEEPKEAASSGKEKEHNKLEEKPAKGNSDEEDSQDYSGAFKLSKWEIMDNDPSNARLNDLDGISEKAKKKYKHRSIEDWLDLDGSPRSLLERKR